MKHPQTMIWKIAGSLERCLLSSGIIFVYSYLVLTSLFVQLYKFLNLA